MKHFKILPFLLLLFLLSACAGPSIDWAVDPARGGYAYVNEELSVQYLADGNSRYSAVSFMGEDYALYQTGQERIVLCTRDGITSCRHETMPGEIGGNPAVAVVEALQSLSYSAGEEAALEGKTYRVYHAVTTGYYTDPVEVPYTCYTLELGWTDGEQYLFRYYAYEDGATLISADAPEEINPMFTADTPWVIDVEAGILRNTHDGAELPLRAVSQSSGQAISPSPTAETVSTYYEHDTCLYTDPRTGRIEKFQQIRDLPGALVTIIHEPNITPPEITGDMIPMDDETLEMALMLIAMMEYE